MQSETKTPRTFERHDLATVVPELVGRVHDAQFASLREIATAYAVDKATALRWKARAVATGLIDERSWRMAMLRALMQREIAA